MSRQPSGGASHAPCCPRRPDVAAHTNAVAPVLNVLVVIDGRHPAQPRTLGFGLGSVLDTLTDRGWGPAHVELGS